MSDEIAKHFGANAPEELTQAAQGRSITLTVTMHPNGQIEFSLPANKVLAHGLLGVAQEQLTKLALMAEMKQIGEARGGLRRFLQQNGGHESCR